MKTLLEDLDSPLFLVDRAWLRRPILIPVFIALVIPCAIGGATCRSIELGVEIKKCW